MLEHLDLSGRPGGSPYYARPDVQPVGDSGIKAWASSDNAENITYLNVAATGLGTGGLTALMQSERLQKLDTLDLSYNPLCGWPAALAGAPAWRTLRTLDIAECGLGDDDIAALTAATAAPRLRSISLAYNSVGSRGAQALASWAVLPQLWALNLHENITGDDGLAVLAASRAAQMLLELDLEQDCWNARARNPGTPLPAEVTDHASFPSLDAMFLGIIDEYHGARYSSGFPALMRADIASASTTRPELAGFLTHLGMEEPDDPGTDEPDDSEWENRGADHDFRAGRAERHMEYLNEARDFARLMMEGEIGWPPPATAVQQTPLSLASVVVHAARLRLRDCATRRYALAVLEAAKGRCESCGSLAVENRPSGPNGKPLPWAQVGRRIGSLGHRVARFNGGSNAPGNLRLVWRPTTTSPLPACAPLRSSRRTPA